MSVNGTAIIIANTADSDDTVQCSVRGVFLVEFVMDEVVSLIITTNISQ